MEPGVQDLLLSLNLGCSSYMFGAKLCKLTQQHISKNQTQYVEIKSDQ